MSRSIVTQREVTNARAYLVLEGGVNAVAPPAAADTPDKWYEQLAKYIPAESIALYMGIEGILKSIQLDSESRRYWLLAGLLLALVFTWLYLRRISNVKLWTQVAISMGALVIYIFALGGVFATFAFYQPWQGSLALLVSTAFLVFVPPPAL
jgi:hypothetical protein